MYFTDQHKHLILEAGKAFYDSRQVAHRLQKLINERIRSQQQRFSAQLNISSSKALRKVYLSSNYQKWLKELIHANYQTEQKKVAWEIGQMRWQVHRIRYNEQKKRTNFSFS